MNMKRIVLVGAVLALAVGVYFYVQPPANRAEEAASAALEAEQLYATFTDSSATKAPLNEVVSITGVVSRVEGSTVILAPGVACRLEAMGETTVSIGERVTLKGRVLGYDDMFEEVQVDFAVVQMEP